MTSFGLIFSLAGLAVAMGLFQSRNKPRDVGGKHRNVSDEPRDVGDKHRDVGDEPRDVGDKHRDVGDQPRDVGDKHKDVGEVYVLLEEHRELVNLRLADMERNWNHERNKRYSLEVKIKRLQTQRIVCNGPVIQGKVCAVPETYQTQLDRLKAGIEKAKQNARTDKGVHSMKGVLMDHSTRLDDIESFVNRTNQTNKAVVSMRNLLFEESTGFYDIMNNTGLLMKRVNQTDKTVGLIQSRIVGITTQLETILRDSSERLYALEIKTDQVKERVDQRDQVVQVQLDTIRSGLGAEKQRTAQVKKAVSTMKKQLVNPSSRLDATERHRVVLIEMVTEAQNAINNITTLHSSLGARVDVIEKSTEFLRKVIDVAGKPSEPDDDYTSAAVCPSKSTVVDCRCSHDDITCDGVEVEGTQCKAWKSDRGSNRIQAFAKCAHGGSFMLVRDPEDGYGKGLPIAICPKGTQVFKCFFHDWYRESGHHEVRMDKDGN